MEIQELQQLLGARIRICIEQAGYRTVEEFAHAFDIGKSTLSNVLSGKKSVTVATLARWANALEIPMAAFFQDGRIDTWVREARTEYFRNRPKPVAAGRKRTKSLVTPGARRPAS